MSISKLSLNDIYKEKVDLYPFNAPNPGKMFLDQNNKPILGVSAMYIMYQALAKKGPLSSDESGMVFVSRLKAAVDGVESEDSKYLVLGTERILSVFRAPQLDTSAYNNPFSGLSITDVISHFADKKGVRVEYCDYAQSGYTPGDAIRIPTTGATDVECKSMTYLLAGKLLVPSEVESNSWAQAGNETMKMIYNVAALAIVSGSVSQTIAMHLHDPIDIRQSMLVHMTDGLMMPLERIRTMSGMLNLYMSKFNKPGLENPELSSSVTKLMSYGCDVGMQSLKSTMESVNSMDDSMGM